MAGSDVIDEAEFSDVTLEYDIPAPAPAAGEEEGKEKEEGQEGAAADGAEGAADDGAKSEKKDGEGDEADPLRDDKGQFKSGFQSRIDRLTRDLRSAERRAATAEAIISARDPSGEGAPKAEPTPADYENYGDYVKDLTKWQSAESEREKAGSTVKDAGEEADTIRAEIWSEKLKAAKTTLKDFDEVVGKSEVQIAPHVISILIDADKGGELAYHLAQNPEIADRLNDMSPARAAMELGRIENDLGPKAPPPKNPSKAPAPIEPVKPGSSTSKKIEDIDDMDDYVKTRKSQGATWA